MKNIFIPSFLHACVLIIVTAQTGFQAAGLLFSCLYSLNLALTSLLHFLSEQPLFFFFLLMIEVFMLSVKQDHRRHAVAVFLLSSGAAGGSWQTNRVLTQPLYPAGSALHLSHLADRLIHTDEQRCCNNGMMNFIR